MLPISVNVTGATDSDESRVDRPLVPDWVEEELRWLAMRWSTLNNARVGNISRKNWDRLRPYGGGQGQERWAGLGCEDVKYEADHQLY